MSGIVSGFIAQGLLTTIQSSATEISDSTSHTVAEALQGQNGPVDESECFLAGTLVATDRGECKIEQLKIGDRVKTVDGKLESVKWIGKQTLSVEHAHPLRALPVQVKAGALGNNLPVRDLYVSPNHALLVDGILVNAGALINGISIVQIRPETETFDYYHVELWRHALILTEGTPTESFIPQSEECHDNFENGEAFSALYPHKNTLAYMPLSLPRVSSQRQLPRTIAKRLNKVALNLYGQTAVR